MRTNRVGEVGLTPSGYQAVVSAMEHDPGVMLDEWKYMGIEVLEHGINLPAAKDPDLVRVNAAKEEGHGTTRAKGPGGEVVWVNASITWNGQCSGTQETGYHRTGNGPFEGILIKIDV